jgi:nicotinate-nucleotide adenylyltransferase
VGLLGGSFNPAHDGHKRLAERALHALQLDQVWLLVSPGNPLKANRPMAPVAERLASASAIADGRRIVATDIERHLDTRFTCDTLASLKKRFPNARFVWLMGADSFRDLPHWRGWQRIPTLVPFAVFPRPSNNPPARAGRAAHRLARGRRRMNEASRLARSAPPAWIYLTGRETSISATALRAAAGQGDTP